MVLKNTYLKKSEALFLYFDCIMLYYNIINTLDFVFVLYAKKFVTCLFR